MDLSLKRCDWCGTDPLYVDYHDNEWGREVTDDRKMFEFLVLESAQAGLSWITILRKRENYRKAFAGFDVHKVAAFTDDDVERLMQDPGNRPQQTEDRSRGDQRETLHRNPAGIRLLLPVSEIVSSRQQARGQSLENHA